MIHPPEPARADPDALLRAAAREARGRLKLFLGAAPGVGKTYEMLSEGAARLREGEDVVVGVVETHGRRETEALTRPFEIIPRRVSEHHGRPLSEMDIDAILARAPQLVLVDELAHSNAPGSRHPKRWQDVEELLAAGIDVYSTINIQHVESLNDVVASFTRVRVRETVPDHVLEQAEIEIVDIPPDELIERLKDGKVYVPEEASRALSHFFSKSNLSALRELALRRAAQAVDAQMLDHLRAHALGGTFAGGDRVLVAVSERPEAEALVRAAKRLADALRAPWTAIHVETGRSSGFGAAERERLARTLALAAQLGGGTASVPATDVVSGLAGYARDYRATQLVLGKSSRSWWFELRHGSVVDRIVRSAEGVAVHVLPIAGQAGAGLAARRTWREGLEARPFLWSLAMVAATVASAVGLRQLLDLNNVAMLFLLPVLAAAGRFGLRPGLFAGLVSALAYNFFLLPPLYTLSISNPENVIAFFVLLIVAVVTSQLAARMRAQAELANRSARQNAALAGFAQRIADAANPDELAQAICGEIARLFNVNAMLFMPSPAGAALVAAVPTGHEPDQLDLAAANWTLEKGKPAGRGSDTLTASDWLFQPIAKGDRTLAALAVAHVDPDGAAIRSDELPLLLSLAHQSALAMDRMQLAEAMRELDVVRSRDRLRAALLSSVGHDLRTPLTTIHSAIGELGQSALAPTDAAIVDALDGEVERLDRFVGNLLDMARAQAGAITLAIEPIDLTDAVASAVHAVRKTLDGHDILLDIPPELPMVRADPQLLHHVLINLLDNAGRYAHPGTPLRIGARRGPDGLSLAIRDEGPGLPEGKETAVFETFTRFDGSDRARGGTGLGLAIARDFAAAMEVDIRAERCADPQGARFTLSWPDRLVVRIDPEALA
ncbi:sensor histidine kinase [Rhizorhabdus wittichii]|uniref:sensor histidine kinase n=1 Tax=Rhizorhabdus wittichii TaxID=160791 RepID=UPI000495977C|nr:sensor histidine kinase KdpD [Rhizorhabdus wittichii]